MASDGAGDGYRCLNLCPVNQKRYFEAKNCFWVILGNYYGFISIMKLDEIKAFILGSGREF